MLCSNIRLSASGHALALSALLLLAPRAFAASHHAASRAAASAAPAAGQMVALNEQPGTDLDAQARILNADDIDTAKRHHEKPVVLVGSAAISTRKEETALFVQLQSASLCGSAGCTTDVYLHRGDDWIKVLDSISGPVTILPKSHGGMYDIVVDGTDRWVWRGSAYHDTMAASSVGDLKGEIKRYQARKNGG